MGRWEVVGGNMGRWEVGDLQGEWGPLIPGSQQNVILNVHVWFLPSTISFPGL